MHIFSINRVQTFWSPFPRWDALLCLNAVRKALVLSQLSVLSFVDSRIGDLTLSEKWMGNQLGRGGRGSRRKGGRRNCV